MGLTRWLRGKEPACQCRRCRRLRFDPWVRKIPWSRIWNLLRYFCLENSMDRGAWQFQSMGLQRVRHDWAHTHIAHNTMNIIIECAFCFGYHLLLHLENHLATCMQDLSSLTRDQTLAPCSSAVVPLSPNHWTTRELPEIVLQFWYFYSYCTSEETAVKGSWIISSIARATFLPIFWIEFWKLLNLKKIHFESN